MTCEHRWFAAPGDTTGRCIRCGTTREAANSVSVFREHGVDAQILAEIRTLHARIDDLMHTTHRPGAGCTCADCAWQRKCWASEQEMRTMRQYPSAFRKDGDE